MNPEILVALVGVFVAFGTASGLVVSRVLAGHAIERKRLRQWIGRPAGAAISPELLVNRPIPAAERLSRWLPVSPRKARKLGSRLAALGYPGPSAVVLFTASEVLLTVVLGLGTLVALGHQQWRVAAAAALIGFIAPGVMVHRRFRLRQKAILNGLPDALDLSVICLEAGCSLDVAITKTSQELSLAHPELAEEFSTLRAEIRAGKPKIEAFKHFADRTELDEVRALAATLMHTDRFGTSVAQALRAHAETARTKRRQRAEERAGKASVKLVFPLVFFLFPAFFVVTLGPAIVQFSRVFMSHVGPGFK